MNVLVWRKFLNAVSLRAIPVALGDRVGNAKFVGISFSGIKRVTGSFGFIGLRRLGFGSYQLVELFFVPLHI